MAVKPCKIHPRSPIGSADVNRDQCWECLGRPASWVCSACGVPFPCGHVASAPALSPEVGVAYADLLRTISAHGRGEATMRVVDRAVRRYETALWRAWTDWAKLGRGN